MASKERLLHKKDFDLKVSEHLPDNLDHEQLLSLPEERNYVAIIENTTELEREEDAREDIIKFLTEFPAQRKKIKRCIRHLHKVADGIDETHKKCTIASIAANTASASSGILTILGLTLAPFTAGGTLVLTAAGLGLGAVAGAAALSTTVYESVNNSKEQKKAQELIKKCRENLRTAVPPDETDLSDSLPQDGVVNENISTVFRVADQACRVYRNVKRIKPSVQAVRYAKANPAMKALAQRAAAAGTQETFRGIQKVRKAFEGTTFAMTKGARLLGVASAGAFLLLDAFSIVQDAKHLTKGAKAETATEIRAKARELEEQLRKLEMLYKQLFII